ncbi:mechanosensitive ion channel [Thermosulfurimonas marina]|uniref:Mechanosensitive ion channel n=1 Tax=Thermosulfurimonas marina TaxID=2047767 RepID=A0A6H1WUV2_9BACT|nr:mechanosensitive ion channel [Thermosulfurimonas marina]
MAYRRLIYTRKFANLLLFLLFLPLLLGFWGINLRGLLVLASSLFALVGVAFFASWSLLSNITSSLILFVAFPLRIGDTIRIVDGDNSVEGEILDMGLFNVKIRTSQGGIVLYPNNLFLQKPVVKILKESPEEVFYPW